MRQNKLLKARDELNYIFDGNRYIDAMQMQGILNRLLPNLPSSLSDYIQFWNHPLDILAVKPLKTFAAGIEPRRHLANELFINRQLKLHADFIKSVDSHGLDTQQARAVFTDECNTLVIAGAGSGKTTTIIGKVQYLIEKQFVAPSQILPISFTKKAASSLEDRIDIEGVEPKTFHALGLAIIRMAKQREVDVLKNDPYNTHKLFAGILSKLFSDKRYSPVFADYFLNYLKPPKSKFEFDSLGDYINYLKENSFDSYKLLEHTTSGRKTHRNEQVKSVEECMIANYLLFNKVEYRYEEQYEHVKERYQPDFTIYANGKKYYLEHFGIDRQGNVPKFFAKPNQDYFEASLKYNSEMQAKIQRHQQYGTTLLTSYSYQLSEGTLLKELEISLIKAGIPLNPMSSQEILETIEDSANKEVDAFVNLLSTFTSLYKSSGLSIADLKRRNSNKDQSLQMYQRTDKFLDIFTLVLNEYQTHLTEENKIDFSDMIMMAVDSIQRREFICPWRYLIIDEFQDMSMSTYRLIRAIQEQRPSIKLFCVGDDWQSIYRFAGSDIGLFVDFESYFGPTTLCRIETTYRFGQPLIDTSSNFILKNPHQLDKHLKAPNRSTDISFVLHSSNESLANKLLACLEDLTEQGLSPTSSVYLLGRYKRDLQSAASTNLGLKITRKNKKEFVEFTFNKGQYTGQKILMEFLTVHRSKGLEADYIFILNCNSGIMGFPCMRTDDPIVGLLLSHSDQYEYGEERRLFYVAMTRAKKKVFVMANSDRQSRFVTELMDGYQDPTLKYCPECKTGALERKDGSNEYGAWAFMGCSNFRYGCEYKGKLS